MFVRGSTIAGLAVWPWPWPWSSSHAAVAPEQHCRDDVEQDVKMLSTIAGLAVDGCGDAQMQLSSGKREKCNA